MIKNKNYSNKDMRTLEDREEYEIEQLKVKDTEEIRELLLLKREMRELYYKITDIEDILNFNMYKYVRKEEKEENEDISNAFYEFRNIIKKIDSFENNILNIIKILERPKIYGFRLQQTQLKKIINVDEFKEIFGYSKSSQQNFRSRLYKPLPFLQQQKKGKILYDCEEVKKWLDENNKK